MFSRTALKTVLLVLKLLNEKLVDFGIKVVLQRQNILNELREPAQKMYEALTEGKEKIEFSMMGLAKTEPSNLRDVFFEKIERVYIYSIRIEPVDIFSI